VARRAIDPVLDSLFLRDVTQSNPPLALDALIHQHQIEAVRLAYLITRQADKAPEIAQATLPLPSSEFRLHWLRGVRLNAARTTGGRPESDDPVWLTDATGKETVIQREMRGLIWDSLGGLSPDGRAVICLRFVSGLKNEALAYALGCSSAEAVRRFRKAKRELAESLSRADDDTRDIEFQGLFEEDTIGLALATQAALAIPPGRDYVGADEAAVSRLEDEIRPAFRLTRGLVARLIAVGVAVVAIGAAVAGITWFGRPPEVVPTPTPTPRPVTETTGDECSVGFSNGQLSRIGRGAISRAQWTPDGRSIWIRSTSGLYAYDATTLRLQLCHSTFDTFARLGPDAATIATAGGGSNGLMLRDAATYQPRTLLLASLQATQTQSIDYHFGVNRIAIATTDNTIEIRDGNTGALLRPAVSLVGRATDLRFSPDGNWVTAVAFGRGLEFIDARKDTASRSFRNPSGFVAEAVFSADSQRAFVSDLNGVQALDLATGGVITTVRESSGFARPIWASADGATVLLVTSASTRDEATLALMDVSSGRALRKLTLSASRFGSQSIVASPDGKRAIVILNDGFSVWDLEQGALINAAAGYAQSSSSAARALAFSPDGRLLAAPRLGGALALYDTSTGRLARQLPTSLRQPVDVAFSTDGARLAVSDAVAQTRNASANDGTSGLNVVDLNADGAISHFFPGAAQPRFSSGGSYLFYRPRDGSEIRYYSFENKVNTGYFRPSKAGETPTFESFAVSPDYGRILIARGDGLEVWDVARSERLSKWSGALVRQFRRDPNTLQIALSPDNQLAAAASAQDGIKVWDAASGNLKYSVTPGSETVSGPQGGAQAQTYRIAFSGDGKWLAALYPSPTTSGAAGSTLTIHEARSGRVVFRVDPPTFAVGIAITTDGRRLAYLSADDVARFVDLEALK